MSTEPGADTYSRTLAPYSRALDFPCTMPRTTNAPVLAPRCCSILTRANGNISNCPILCLMKKRSIAESAKLGMGPADLRAVRNPRAASCGPRVASPLTPPPDPNHSCCGRPSGEKRRSWSAVAVEPPLRCQRRRPPGALRAWPRNISYAPSPFEAGPTRADTLRDSLERDPDL